MFTDSQFCIKTNPDFKSPFWKKSSTRSGIFSNYAVLLESQELTSPKDIILTRGTSNPNGTCEPPLIANVIKVFHIFLLLSSALMEVLTSDP